MAGKYAGVIDKLPKFVDPDQSHQDEVDLLKLSLLTTLDNGPKLAEAYVQVRDEEAKLDEEMKGIHLRKRALEQLITDQFEHDDISSLKLASGHSVSVQLEPTAQTIDREANRLWCIRERLENQMVLHPSTLLALTKQRLLDGLEAPDGVKVSARAKLVLRRG
jgi:hypothetical protein